MQVERFICLGRISSQNKSITVKVQRELVRYVIGTHQTMTQSYPEWAKFRQKNWRSWVEGTKKANQYQKICLPYIAVHFWNVWDGPVSRGMDPLQLTPTVLDLVKNKIIDLMVHMFLLPSSIPQSAVGWRSRRNMVTEDDTEIPPVPSR